MPFAHMQQKNVFPGKVLRFDWTGLGQTPSEPITVEENVEGNDSLILAHKLYLWILGRQFPRTTWFQRRSNEE